MTLILSNQDASFLGYVQNSTTVPKFENTYISEEEEYTIMVVDNKGNRQFDIERDIIEIINQM
jgi:hypothetical protein